MKYRAHLGAVAAFVLGGALLTPGVASAASDPLAGPTSGGTTVSDSDELGVRFTKVVASSPVSVALDVDGNAWGWGYNRFGQLGEDSHGDDVETPVKILPPEGVEFTEIGVAQKALYALSSAGVVYAWGALDMGDEPEGLFGTGEGFSLEPIPVLMPAGVAFTQLSVGERHAVALGADGTAYAWGWGAGGELGTGQSGTGTYEEAPVRVAGSQKFAEVSAGSAHTVAVDVTGNLWAWGTNNVGQVGVSELGGHVATPVQVPAPAGVRFTHVSTGGDWAIALDTGGNIWAFGRNDSMGLGYRTPLTRISTGVEFTEIDARFYSAQALDNNGNAYGFGRNADGQLGDGSFADSGVPGPVRMPAGVKFTQISSGYKSSGAVGTDGNTYTWGTADRGYLGDGSSSGRPEPASITDVTLTNVSFGGVAGSGLSQDGTAPGQVSWAVTTPEQCGRVPVVAAWEQFGASHEESRGEFVFGSAPSISVEPASQEVEEGGTFTATATVSGDSAPTIQWQALAADGSWEALAGETGDTLTIEGVRADAEYRAVARNCWGAAAEATSGSAAVTVAARPAGPSSPTGPAPTGPAAPVAESPKHIERTPAAPGEPAAVWVETVLAETGGGALLPIGAAVATLALLAGGILLVARKRRQAPEPSDG